MISYEYLNYVRSATKLNTYKKSKFSREILEFVKNIGFIFPGFESKYEHIRRLRKATYYGTFRRLEQRQLIQRKIIGGKLAYKLTKRGYELVNTPVARKKRNDGFTTIVIFDIPEEKRRARRALRTYLKNNGFKILQKSVYYSTSKVPKTLIELVSELEIQSHVSVIGGSIEYYL